MGSKAFWAVCSLVASLAIASLAFSSEGKPTAALIALSFAAFVAFISAVYLVFKIKNQPNRKDLQ